jgi:hypothetical protein
VSGIVAQFEPKIFSTKFTEPPQHQISWKSNELFSSYMWTNRRAEMDMAKLAGALFLQICDEHAQYVEVPVLN